MFHKQRLTVVIVPLDVVYGFNKTLFKGKQQIITTELPSDLLII